MAGARRLRPRVWEVAPRFAGADEVARKLALTPLLAQILHNRGASSVEEARSFLNPRLEGLHGPELLPNIDAAAVRIATAIHRNEKITLYGDYDVDGMTAVAVLRSCLAQLGANVEWYVPHRLEEGYGVNAEAIARIIEGGTRLIVTVDCGISAQGPCEQAAAAGVDVIITDHHLPPAQLPPALAIVHPTLAGSRYPNEHLCGSGVAFKLAWQVARTVQGSERVDERMRHLLLEGMCLAALGTIADVVPLVGENRIFATYGLKALPATRHVGLQALLAASGLTGEDLDAYHVGFVLAPRLNACGRMGHAALAVELLTSASGERSVEIAGFLNKQNQERQTVEREIAEQARDMVRAQGMDRDDCRAIVLASRDWHAGVIGIVASRLVEQFHRPAILIALDGDKGQGSGRSIGGFHLHDAMAACAGHLEGFGGHAMAAGLRIAPQNVEAFTQAFVAHANERITPERLAGNLRVDAEAKLSSIDYNVVAHLVKFAPFGQGNPAPVLAIRNCRVINPPRRMGKGTTVGMVLGQNGTTMRAVGFNMGDLADDLVGVGTLDVAAEPVLNTFNGRTSVELKLKDVRLPGE